ncbi:MULTISPECIES: BF3164 family lipoprotein [Capnocytophaga]|uniref:BF3164 family lipoprotein n=1 Tax=Capnocytophaga TaxID=1016 RepID=UPI000BB16EA1|nr:MULTISPECIES: BF3164 family lipoprotein [Capnocytophaga]ATA75891.1 hypothetical protein CGC52_10985 [Capnocytophaga sp. H2931]
MRKIIYLYLCFFSLISCKEETLSNEYMSFDEVQYVENFPKSRSLIKEKMVDFGVLGVNRFRIVDSLLFLSTNDSDALWKLVSLPKQKVLGAFLKKGQGPNDFPMAPNLCTQTWISNQNNEWIAHIYDFNRGKLCKLNISQVLANKTEELIISELDLPQSLFNVQMLDETHFFCKTLNNEATSQERFMFRQNNKRIPPPLAKLNEAHVRRGEDTNILSTLVKYDHEKDILVEMPLGLNYINMYSLQNDTIAKTICLGKEMNSITSIQNTFRWNRMYTFCDVRSFKNFFGVMFINEKEKNYQTNRENLPTIFLFDWEGNPLIELKLDHLATSFDIDFTNNKLYTLDSLSDEMFVYDITHILSEMK